LDDVTCGDALRRRVLEVRARARELRGNRASDDAADGDEDPCSDQNPSRTAIGDLGEALEDEDLLGDGGSTKL